MLAQRKPIRLRSIEIWDVADGAGLDQRADHGGAQRAGSAGDDDMAVAIIHRLLPLLPNVPASSIMSRAMQGPILRQASLRRLVRRAMLVLR
jgi:hypothetical protein